MLSLFIRNSRPLALLAGVLLYALGSGVVVYLGYPLDWTRYWLGQACVTLLQLSSYYLKTYYALPDPSARRNARRRQDPLDAEENLPRPILLQAAFTTLTIGAVITVLLVARGAMNPPTLFILGVAFLLSFFYAVPPVRLVDSGYGELSEAILVMNLTPALAFLFQTGSLHRLLVMLTFPLTALYLAMSLAIAFSHYASDLKYERRTLLVRMGWQRGMNLHNLLILGAYFLFGFATLLDLPWSLTWPALLTLPFGIYQIWQMRQIANGASPRWRLLTFTAMIVVGLSAYFLTLALWTG